MASFVLCLVLHHSALGAEQAADAPCLVGKARKAEKRRKVKGEAEREMSNAGTQLPLRTAAFIPLTGVVFEAIDPAKYAEGQLLRNFQ